MSIFATGQPSLALFYCYYCCLLLHFGHNFELACFAKIVVATTTTTSQPQFFLLFFVRACCCIRVPLILMLNILMQSDVLLLISLLHSFLGIFGFILLSRVLKQYIFLLPPSLYHIKSSSHKIDGDDQNGLQILFSLYHKCSMNTGIKNLSDTLYDEVAH